MEGRGRNEDRGAKVEPHPSRWPLPLSSFVGRVDVLAELARVARDHALVTVLGAPGIGKTRLVTEWLRGSDQTFFCDLTDAARPRDLLSVVAKSLGVAIGGDAAASIVQVGAVLVAMDEPCLVLDNIEQLVSSRSTSADGAVGEPEVETASSILQAWRSAAPRARFVVTSRERLRIPGEIVFELGPLGLPDDEARIDADVDASDAVRLFVVRASEARWGFALGPKDHAVVAQLVRELDGNPLAIELAAARTRVLSPAEILARMNERFAVLVAAEPGEPRRSALLEAIDASYRMLPDWAKAALEECSVFRDGFDLAAASDVVGHAPGIVEALELLCDKSLLVARRSPRRTAFRFRLHASIRAFAAEKLDASGRGAEVQRRHARTYARAGRVWSALLDTEEAHRGVLHLREEIANLTHALATTLACVPSREAADDALDLALALNAILSLDGPFDARASALESAIAFADRTTADPERLADALTACVLAQMAVGRADASRAAAKRAHAVATAHGAPAVVARALAFVGLSLGMDGRWDEAGAALDEALGCAREVRDLRASGRILGRLAWLSWARGDLDRALARYHEAVLVNRESGDRVFAAMNGGYLAMVAHDLGDLDSPRALLEAALEEHRRLGHRRVEGEFTAALATLLHERCAYDEAREMQTRAAAIYARLGHTRDRGSLLVEMGTRATDEGKLDEARALYLEALPLARAADNTMTVVEAEARLGVLAARRDALAEARLHFARASELAREGPREADLVALLGGHLDLAVARAARAGGDHEAAGEAIRSARRRLETLPSPRPGGVHPVRTLRMAAASLDAAVDEVSVPFGETSTTAPATSVGEELVLLRSDRAIRIPGGVTIELARSPALWRIAECLAEARREGAGVARSVEALVVAGWPDERVLPEPGARRVYTALSTLRQRGLRPWLMNSAGGYRYDPAITVRIDG